MTEDNGEKRETLQEMLDVWKKDTNYLSRVAKELVFNSDQPLQDRYTGLMILLDDIANKKQKLEIGQRRLNAYLNSLCELALKEHKKRRIINFTQRWAGKEVCELMAEEMRNLEKPNHCYRFQGITVIEEDCNLCRSRKCERGDADYVPNKFEELVKIIMPEGTHHIDDTLAEQQESLAEQQESKEDTEQEESEVDDEPRE